MALHTEVNAFTCRGKWFYIERENSGKYNLLVISVTEAVAKVDVFPDKTKNTAHPHMADRQYSN